MKKNIADLLAVYRFRTLAVDLWYVVGRNQEFEVLIELMKDGKTYRFGVRQMGADLNDVVWLLETRNAERLDGLLQILEL